jgi:hypothetical protein
MQVYNPSYLRGGDQVGLGSRPVLGEKFMRPHLNQWLSVVAHACHLSYSGKHK